MHREGWNVLLCRVPCVVFSPGISCSLLACCQRWSGGCTLYAVACAIICHALHLSLAKILEVELEA
eukprot:scaffold196718_cov37-Tisochrysis_lutea.AAC.1